ncbi:MAG: AMP-binding protein, partial [Pseudomonas sp.]
MSLALAHEGRNEQVRGMLGRFERSLPLNVQIASDVPLLQALQGFRATLAEARSWLECLDESAAHSSEDLALEYAFAPASPTLASGVELWMDPCALPLLSLAREGQALRLAFDAERLQAGAAALCLEQLCIFVGSAVADLAQRLDKVALLGAQERAQIALFEQGASQTLQSPGALHRLFEVQHTLGGERLAVRQGDETLSYADLERRANQVARALQANGVGRECIVGVYAQRSVAALVAMLGILKAGGAYLPLDPAYPAERLGYMLADAGVHCLLTLQAPGAALALPEGLPCLSLAADSGIWRGDASPLSVVVQADALAYVIYTSGSTGKPKGVAVSHA